MKGNTAVLVAALAAGESLQAAATTAGMGLTTAKRRVADPEVRAAVEEAERELTRQLASRFRAVREIALDRLREFLLEGGDRGMTLRGIEVALKQSANADTAAMHLRLLEVERGMTAFMNRDNSPTADDGGWGVSR